MRPCKRCEVDKPERLFYRKADRICKKCTELARRHEKYTNVPDLKFQQLAQGLWK